MAKSAANKHAKTKPAKKPVTKKPVTKKPVAKKPVAKKPAAKKPAAKKPIAKKPIAKKPAAKKPVAGKPAAAGAAARTTASTPAALKKASPGEGPSSSKRDGALPDVQTAMRQLEILVSAHPGLVLERTDAKSMARETPDLDALIRAYPREVMLLVYCTWTYRKLGRFGDALRAAELATGLERSWPTLTAKASVHRASGEVDAAIALFDEASTLDLEDTSALMEGARTLGEAKRFGEAARWFGRVVEREPEHTDARVWQAYAAYLDRPSETYIEILRSVLRDDPNNDLAERLLSDMTSS